jgi:hypothetical protein
MNEVGLLKFLWDNRYDPVNKAAHRTFERPMDYGSGKEIRAINLSKKNALDHAYAADLVGKTVADLYEKSALSDNNAQDLQNNLVGAAFARDLKERDPMLNIYQRMLRAAKSIRDRDRMRNPQYPWAYYENRKNPTN